MRNLIETFRQWEDGNKVYFGMITKTKGSTYRKTGAQIVINDKGDYSGLLSGGCIEKDLGERVKKLASENIAYETCSYCNYHDDPILGFNTGCNGDTHILLLSAEWLKKHKDILSLAIDQGDEIKIISIVDNYTSEIKNLLFINDQHVNTKENALQPVIPEAILNQRGSYSYNEKTYFIHHFEHIQKIVIFGGGDDSQPVADMAAGIGYDVFVMDFREGLLTPNRFKSESIHKVVIKNNDFGILSRFPQNTPVVIMSHNFSFDKAALMHCIAEKFNYIGVLGPRTRLAKLLGNKSLTNLSALKNPIGLDINARTPEEIAISILGEIICYKNNKEVTFHGTS